MENIVEITPKHKLVPAVTLWTNEITQLEPYGQARAARNDMDEIIRKQHLKGKVEIDIMNGIVTKMPEDISLLVKKCDMLRGLSPQIDREWASNWEVINASLFENLCQKIESKIKSRTDAAREKNPDANTVLIKDYPFRSFHIGDNTGTMSEVIQEMIKRVTFTTQAHFAWEWIANHSSNVTPEHALKVPSRWITGIDGKGRCSLPNLRAWKNRLAISLKKPDLITSSYGTVYDSCAAMAFALLVLNPGGNAIIRIPHFAHTSTITMTHLFSNCFEKTHVVNTQCGDNIFVCGMNYLAGKITSKYQTMLFEFLEKVETDVDNSLYAVRFYKDDNFIELIQKLESIQTLIFDRRVSHYTSILNLYKILNSSRSVSTFTKAEANLIEENFPDLSRDWMRKTGMTEILPNP